MDRFPYLSGMARLSVDPPIRNASTKTAFVQIITATEGGKVVGKAIWASSPTQAGTIQIIAMEVDQTVLRQRIGSQLMTRLFEESAKRSKSLGIPLRRIWLLIEQKTQIAARGFLTGHGFHHVKTVDALLKDEAGMIYVKSFD